MKCMKCGFVNRAVNRSTMKCENCQVVLAPSHEGWPGHRPPDVSCRVCDVAMTRDVTIKNDPDFCLLKVQRGIYEPGETEPSKKLTIETDSKVCRRCFWRLVQKTADYELIQMTEPSDFKV